MSTRSIPVKPDGAKWTDEQWEAIHLAGNDLLVSAAAGSGKTAVLVERIIRRISDEQNPLDVDRLLVATFTKAAAAEMRHRIREALEQALVRHPESEHLRKQLSLLNRASITTLHSFCLDVIRRYFHVIDLDPGFRMADETESRLMRQELLEQLLEEKYASAEEGDAFWQLAEWFGGERSDEPLLRIIDDCYDASRSHPFPERWLREMAAMFRPGPDGTSAGIALWQDSLMQQVRLELDGLCALLRQAREIALSPNGPAPYADTLERDLDMAERFLQAAREGWGALFDAMQDMKFEKLKPCKKDSCDPALQEKAKALRESAKTRLSKLKEELFTRSPDQFKEEVGQLAPLMEELVRLVEEYARRYKQAKTEKRLLDFHDLEHYCLQILRDPAAPEGILAPSPAALAYRDQFAEILLDEYQDTNMVQEAIVRLISRDNPGNRFMVGDVKQSIYRFRLAEPGLFLEKYRSYTRDGRGAGKRIELARNFRSRRQVVDAVNYLFRLMMTETAAEMDYDRDAELVYGASYPEWPRASDSDPDPCAVRLLLIDKADEAIQAEEGHADEGPDERDSGVPPSTDPLEDEWDDLETAEWEARAIGQQIRRLLGEDGGERFRVTDRSGEMRPVEYRDMVILLRATERWSQLFLEQFKQLGIPAYADINTGYFAATEVQTILSLLQVIDNPYQDIPLAAVLRSPLVGLSANDLARIRLANRQGHYFDAFLDVLDQLRQQDGRNAEAGVATLETVAAELGTGSGLRQLEWDLPGWNEAAAATEAERSAKPVLPLDGDAADKLLLFAERLEVWRDMARQGSLTDLIWDIYRKTGYYDFVGGLPGGAQRQANLRALIDRARQYEATSFRGLFRFLRFIERLQESGQDLGTARALGEQENVVRIMSIHKSKGLEFPVVFVAGMGKKFNLQDVNGSFLIHKDLGFGPRMADLELRIQYPSLPQLAIRHRMRRETLAEEMRILYVALTRAKERLILVGTVSDLGKTLQAWARAASTPGEKLPDHELVAANGYLDWVGPAIMRHPAGQPLRELAGMGEQVPGKLQGEPSQFVVDILRRDQLTAMDAEQTARAAGELAEVLRSGKPVPDHVLPQDSDLLAARLSWEYPHEAATRFLTKTSVTELKRLSDRRVLQWSAGEWNDDEGGWPEPAGGPTGTGLSFGSGIPSSSAADFGMSQVFDRPRFMSRQALSAAEIGTVYHAVMQHAPLGRKMTAEEIAGLLEDMLRKGLLTEEERKAVEPDKVAAFWNTEVGQRFVAARNVWREIPFTYGIPARELHPDATGESGNEIVLIQGVIDCLFEDAQGLVLLDFKTDAVRGRTPDQMAERHRLQLGVYKRAIEDIWKRSLQDVYLYFFDGPFAVRLQADRSAGMDG